MGGADAEAAASGIVVSASAGGVSVFAEGVRISGWVASAGVGADGEVVGADAGVMRVNG
ncbi:hypothetical protein ACQPZJ_34815 [Actinoplanes sp. CA-054009]